MKGQISSIPSLRFRIGFFEPSGNRECLASTYVEPIIENPALLGLIMY